MKRRKHQKKFSIIYTLEVTLNKDEIWPDGDAPANPTAEDVKDVILKCGGFPKIIEDWNLDDGSDPEPFTVTEEK